MSPTRTQLLFVSSLALLGVVTALWFVRPASGSVDLLDEVKSKPAQSLTASRSEPVEPTATTNGTAATGTTPETRAGATPPGLNVVSKNQTAAGTSVSSSDPGPGVPRRIAVPRLRIDAPVVAVGLRPDGSMRIPDAVEAGWYHYGPRPGDATGSAVIAGHVDHNRAPGVFLELRRLQIGDAVVVTDDRGTTRRFTVVERLQVNKRKLPGDELFRTDGRPLLTLISCGGSFNRRTRSYADNIVIRAVPSGSQRATAGETSGSG